MIFILNMFPNVSDVLKMFFFYIWNNIQIMLSDKNTWVCLNPWSGSHTDITDIQGSSSFSETLLLLDVQYH